VANQALSFGEGAIGATLLVMGISGASVREVLAGKGGHIKPIAAGASSSSAPAAAGPPAHSNAFTTPGKGGGSDPLPGWIKGRIDAGVDYSGGAKIMAPESGRILKVGPYGGASGGFGPGGILLEGASGRIWYFYEGLVEHVHAGQIVSTGQLIATGIPGGSIEVGFANGEGDPLAQVAGESTGDNITKWGRKAAEALGLLGAPR
jgi:hypothetical protein